MKILTKLELVLFFMLISYICLRWSSILSQYTFLRVFDFSMAIYFWSFVACYDREELIELKKISKKEANNPLNYSFITIYDVFICILVLFIKFLNDFNII